MDYREKLKDKKRIVIKIGSSSLTYGSTGRINLQKLEKLVRTLCDLKNQGKDIVLVSSGSIAVGKSIMRFEQKSMKIPEKQAYAAIGQANLMLIYQKLFSEYSQVSAQILMTKDTVVNNLSRYNAKNTFEELFNMDVIPIVNENDTISTYEIQFGDNDRLSAIVAGLVRADLLILLSDIDGLFTDDPKQNPDAKFVDFVPELTDDLMNMGKSSSSSNVGTGGMSTKLMAAKIATGSGADMIIANGEEIDVIYEILNGNKIGTLFSAHKKNNFDLIDYLEE